MLTNLKEIIPRKRHYLQMRSYTYKITYNEIYVIIYSINGCIIMCAINLLWININCNYMLAPGKGIDIVNVEQYSFSTVKETLIT
jgi:hypothetical protein